MKFISKQRIVSAAIITFIYLIFGVCAFFYNPGFKISISSAVQTSLFGILTLAICLVCTYGLWEIIKNIKLNKLVMWMFLVSTFVSILLVSLLGYVVFNKEYFNPNNYLYLVELGVLLFNILGAYLLFSSKKFSSEKRLINKSAGLMILIILFGIAVVSVLFNLPSSIYGFTNNYHGWEYLLMFFIIAIFTDTFAFIFGCKYGRHKMAVKISPNKSWEGSAAGLIGSIIIATAIYLILNFTAYTGWNFSHFLLINYHPGIDWLNIIEWIIIVALLSVVGQLGDLFFSKIKRTLKIKDFSNIIPGHGGIFDRLDSLVFIAFFGFIFILFSQSVTYQTLILVIALGYAFLILPRHELAPTDHNHSQLKKEHK